MVARAPQGERMRQVGVLMAGLQSAGVDAFKRGLAGLGWTEDRNIRFEARYSTAANEMAADATVWYAWLPTPPSSPARPTCG
jgi:hypothetical protein